MNKRDKEFAVQSQLMRKYNYAYSKDLQDFADLIRADEREACARLLEGRKTGAGSLMDVVRDMEAAAIRARGQA